MSFYTSPCNIIHKDNDSNSEFYRKIISSIIILELFIVIVSIFYSTVKNNLSKIVKTQVKQDKKEQTQSIDPQSNQIKGLVISKSVSIYKTLKSGKSLKQKKIMNLGENCSDNVDICESVVLEKKTNITSKEGEIKMKKQPSIEENKSNQLENENGKKDPDLARGIIRQSQIIPNLSDNDQSKVIDGMASHNIFFINIGNLRLCQDKASTYFNILLGHFFVSGSLSMMICPELMTGILAVGHCVLFLIILIGNILIVQERDHKIMEISSDRLKKEEEKNNEKIESIDLNIHDKQKENNQAWIKTEKQVQKKSSSPIKHKINTIVQVLILTLNICLLGLTVIRMKEGYYNVTQLKCS